MTRGINYTNATLTAKENDAVPRRYGTKKKRVVETSVPAYRSCAISRDARLCEISMLCRDKTQN